MDKYLKQLTTFLKNLTARQRVLLGGATAVIVVTLWIFVRLFVTPDFKPLYTGLSSSDAQGIAQRLAAQNVAYKISPDGSTISVPEGKLDQLRLEMSAQGPPQTGRMGFELFDKPNWSGSDFSEKVNYQRALEGELERTIETIDDVQAARVHIVMPHESLFTDEERQAKAAVVIKLRGGSGLSSEEVTGIARLVASAVDSLTPQNVTIIDADTGAPLQARIGQDSAAGNSTLETDLAQKLVATLSPIVGQGRVKASVAVERDPTSGSSTQETYDPNGSVVLSSQVSDEQGGGNSPSGVPGTASNVPRASGQAAATTVATASANSQTLHTENKTYAVSKTVRNLVEPAGRIKRMTVALLVDDAVETKEVDGKTQQVTRKRTPEEMKQIQDIAMAAVGLNPTRGDEISVQDFPFLTLPVEQPVPPTIAQRIQLFTEHWVTALRYVGLLVIFLVVYLFLLKPIKNQLVESFRAAAQAPAARMALAAGGNVPTGSASEINLIEKGLNLDEEISETSSDVKRVVMLKRDLVEKVKKEPAASSRLVQNWIRQTSR
jgi:flagellar M-ring protein FliF